MNQRAIPSIYQRSGGPPSQPPNPKTHSFAIERGAFSTPVSYQGKNTTYIAVYTLSLTPVITCLSPSQSPQWSDLFSSRVTLANTP